MLKRIIRSFVTKPVPGETQEEHQLRKDAAYARFYSVPTELADAVVMASAGVLLGMGIGEWIPGSAPALAGISSILVAVFGFIRIEYRKTEGWLNATLFALFLLFGSLFAMNGIGL